MRRITNNASRLAVSRVVDQTVTNAVFWAIPSWDVQRAVRQAFVRGHVRGGVFETVAEVLEDILLDDPQHPALQDFIQEAEA